MWTIWHDTIIRSTNNALNGIQLQATRQVSKCSRNGRSAVLRVRGCSRYFYWSPKYRAIRACSLRGPSGERQSPEQTKYYGWKQPEHEVLRLCARFLNPASKSLSSARTAKTILSRGSPRNVVPLSPRAISIYTYALLDFSQNRWRMCSSVNGETLFSIF